MAMCRCNPITRTSSTARSTSERRAKVSFRIQIYTSGQYILHELPLMLSALNPTEFDTWLGRSILTKIQTLPATWVPKCRRIFVPPQSTHSALRSIYRGRPTTRPFRFGTKPRSLLVAQSLTCQRPASHQTVHTWAHFTSFLQKSFTK